jgi:hypothetical protein
MPDGFICLTPNQQATFRVRGAFNYYLKLSRGASCKILSADEQPVALNHPIYAEKGNNGVQILSPYIPRVQLGLWPDNEPTVLKTFIAEKKHWTYTNPIFDTVLCSSISPPEMILEDCPSTPDGILRLNPNQHVHFFVTGAFNYMLHTVASSKWTISAASSSSASVEGKMEASDCKTDSKKNSQKVDALDVSGESESEEDEDSDDLKLAIQLSLAHVREEQQAATSLAAQASPVIDQNTIVMLRHVWGPGSYIPDQSPGAARVMFCQPILQEPDTAQQSDLANISLPSHPKLHVYIG